MLSEGKKHGLHDGRLASNGLAMIILPVKVEVGNGVVQVWNAALMERILTSDERLADADGCRCRGVACHAKTVLGP